MSKAPSPYSPGLRVAREKAAISAVSTEKVEIVGPEGTNHVRLSVRMADKLVSLSDLEAASCSNDANAQSLAYHGVWLILNGYFDRRDRLVASARLLLQRAGVAVEAHAGIGDIRMALEDARGNSSNAMDREIAETLRQLDEYWFQETPRQHTGTRDPASIPKFVKRLEEILEAGEVVSADYAMHGIMVRDEFIADLLREVEREVPVSEFYAASRPQWKEAVALLVRQWNAAREDSRERRAVAKSAEIILYSMDARTASETSLMDLVDVVAASGEDCSEYLVYPLFASLRDDSALQVQAGARFISRSAGGYPLERAFEVIFKNMASDDELLELVGKVGAMVDVVSLEPLAMQAIEHCFQGEERTKAAKAFEVFCGSRMTNAAREFVRNLRSNPTNV